MDGLKNYREKIKSIEKLVDKMENGELSINELVELEGLTRDLHERSIILKYKAFENKSGDIIEESEVAEPEVEAVEEEVVEEEEEILFEAEETPVMDFSMFDAPVAEEKIEEPKKEVTPEIEKPAAVEEANAQYQDKGTGSDHEKATPIVEKLASEPVAKNEPVEEPAPEPEVKADPITEEPKAVVNEKGTSFLDRLNIVDNSISSQIAGSKIDSLSGAFGINQRLLYINELFDGSGEDFSDAIKVLDSQSGLDEASTKVEELAFKNSWNPEEEVVLEFLAIIKRRYA